MRLTRSQRKFAVLAVLAVLALPACEESVAPIPALRPVRYEVVAAGDAARTRTFAGVARAGLESSLSFRVAGTIVEIPVVVGSKVRRGDLLARIDPTDYQLLVQEALAALAQAQAAARNAEADYDRVRSLYENNNSSRRELDGARAGFESSEAQVEAARKRLEKARNQVSYCTLLAPADGTVASADVEINENVNAGQRLFLLISGATTDVEIAVPEALVAGIYLGQPATVMFDALPAREFPATVTEAGVASVGTATTFPITVRLEKSDADIRSGMAADVVLRFEPEGHTVRLMVPAVSVGEDRQGRFVFLLERMDDEKGLVHRTPVTVGQLTADGLEVLSGLAEGDLVVTAGVRRLVDGQEVALAEPLP